METLILKSFKDGIDGVVECVQSKSSVKVKYSVRIDGEGIYKLMLLSSLKPGNEPVIVDTPEPSPSCASGEREVGVSELAFRGYNPFDADTFILALREKGTFIPVAAGFSRLAWNIEENSFFARKAETDESLERARSTLDGLKQSACPQKYCRITERLESLKSELSPSVYSPMEELLWYDVSSGSLPVEESAYTHITGSMGKGVPMLFGIGEGGLTALAVSQKEKNPFANAGDCVTEKNGFYIVGILFGEDGQYFARL